MILKVNNIEGRGTVGINLSIFWETNELTIEVTRYPDYPVDEKIRIFRGDQLAEAVALYDKWAKEFEEHAPDNT